MIIDVQDIPFEDGPVWAIKIESDRIDITETVGARSSDFGLDIHMDTEGVCVEMNVSARDAVTLRDALVAWCAKVGVGQS
jgi:tRNA threonylcarbamoyladenosine modification (KEOPS) complex  Pcc1 subunit